MPKFEEREITAPVELCNKDGGLNRESLGWSRFPLHICNLSGHWPKKKKWNFWLVLNQDFAFSATIANVDFAGLGAAYLMDFKNGLLFEDFTLIPRGAGVNMPDRVDEDVVLKNKKLSVSFTHTADKILIKAESPSFHDRKLSADITLEKSPDHETLNVVIPWSDEQFHFTSKQNTRSASGSVVIDDKVYDFNPEDSFGVLDFGRGIWPSNFVWNWAVLNHRQGDDLIGMNLGGKWTDGTGACENGFCVNGKLYKISEDVIFDYNKSDFMEPWTMKTQVTDILNLKLTPVYRKAADGNSNTATDQVFGRFSGTLKLETRTIEIKDAFGWSEQVIGNW